MEIKNSYFIIFQIFFLIIIVLMIFLFLKNKDNILNKNTDLNPPEEIVKFTSGQFEVSYPKKWSTGIISTDDKRFKIDGYKNLFVKIINDKESEIFSIRLYTERKVNKGADFVDFIEGLIKKNSVINKDLEVLSKNIEEDRGFLKNRYPNLRNPQTKIIRLVYWYTTSSGNVYQVMLNKEESFLNKADEKMMKEIFDSVVVQ